MICLSLKPSREEDLDAGLDSATSLGIRCVEIRLDRMRRVPGPEFWTRRPGTVVVACRRPRDGGEFQGTEVERLRLLEDAGRAGADYVDVEEDVAAGFPRPLRARLLVSHHDFGGTPDPEELEARVARMVSLGAHAVKIACLARRLEDNLRIAALLARPRPVPLAAFCLGELGTLTRRLGPALGSWLTYAFPRGASPTGSGQVPAEELIGTYRALEVSPATVRYGLVGWPVGHSWSPYLHNRAYARAGIDALYVPIPCEDLEEGLRVVRTLRFSGFQVTLPHKEAVLRHLTALDAAAKACGAVNTVRIDGDRWKGFNTDGPAFLECLEDALGAGWARGKSVIVLGTGGAARAVVASLVRAGAQVTVSGRSEKKAREVASAFGARPAPIDGPEGGRPDLWVNATPVGMHPDVEATPLAAGRFEAGQVVADIVYNPARTRLLRDAESRACRIVPGTGMFVRQAARAIRIWTGREAHSARMREDLQTLASEGG